MANQKGAALIVVLSLLVGSLVIGLSSMQSSLVDERLAGSQKVATELAMGAEAAGSLGFSNIRSFLPGLLNDAECRLVDEDDDNSIFFRLLDEGNEIVDRESFVPDWGFVSTLPKLSDLECFSAPDFDAITDAVGDEACDGNGMDCVYRYVALGGVDGDGESVEDRYIVAMSRLNDSEGNSLGVSRPLFIKVLASDPDFDLVAGSSPITFLADFDISQVKISGANNMTLSGGEGAEISVPPSVYYDETKTKVGGNEFTPKEFIIDGFDNKKGTPEVAPGGVDIDDFIELVEGLRVASLELGVPGIYFEDSDPDMKPGNYPDGGIMVVADNFTWSGQGDFKGIIIVLGATVHYQGGGSGDLSGSLIHAPITPIVPDYGWVDEDGFVEFPSVTRFRKGEWEFGNANFAFDFSGGGNSVLQNEADSFDYAMEVITGAPGFARATSWEFD